MWPQDPDPDDNWLAPQKKDEEFVVWVFAGAAMLGCTALAVLSFCILRWW